VSEHDADEAFIRYKSRHVVSHALANARKLHRHPCATAMGRALEGRTALLVGAAPTPDVDGDLLRAAQDRGAVVLGVNSSSPVLAALGVTPDAIVVRESIDMSADVAASPAPLVCLDVCAHPNAWEAAGNRGAWFVPGYPHTSTLAMHSNAPPLFGGSAAVTAAAKLAIQWGAARIVLVGISLAYVRGGDEWLSYHASSPRGDSRSRIEDGHIIASGNASDDERCKASGQPPPAKRLPCEWVPASDNSGMLPTIATLLDQKRWLESEAVRHGKRIMLRNATRGGAAAVGWGNADLRGLALTLEGENTVNRRRFSGDEPVRFPAAGAYAVSRAENAALLDALRREAELQRMAADELLRPTGPRLDAIARMPGLHLGAPLPEALAAWRMVDAPQGNPRECMAHNYSALRDAANEAIAMLSGGLA
jgi:hypothetical protein